MHDVPDNDGDIIAAGPLRARLAAGQVRIGWDEPDWLGPGGVRAPNGVAGSIVALADESVLVLRLEAQDAQQALATGEFAAPAVAWDFTPSARLDGGAPDDLRAFGHQYTEFALPVFSDAAMERWRLLPIRPSVVLPLGLVAPDGRTILLAPLLGFHEQVIAVPDREHPQ